MHKNRLWLLPGPVDISPKRLLKRGTLIEKGYGSNWFNRYKLLSNKISKLFEVDTTFILPGNTHLGLDIGIKNIAVNGTNVLVLQNGFWGKRLSAIIKSNGYKVIELDISNNKIFTFDEINRFIIFHKIKTIALVHGESSKGILNDLYFFSKVCEINNISLIVDAVATLGAVPVNIPFDINFIIVSSVVKGIGSECGLVLLLVSNKMKKSIKLNNRAIGYFSNLLLWYELINDKNKITPTIGSISISNFNILFDAIEIIEKEGLNNRYKRHKLISEKVIQGIKKIGFKLLNPNQILPTITVAYVPNYFTSNKIIQELANNNIYIDCGIEENSEKIIRIGHMSENATLEKIDYFLKILTKIIKEKE